MASVEWVKREKHTKFCCYNLVGTDLIGALRATGGQY